MENCVYDIWLSLHMPAGKNYPANLLNTFGNAYEVFRAEPEELARTKIPVKELSYLAYKDLDKSYGVLKFCEKNGIGIIPYGSPSYPRRLAGIGTPPALLYVKGTLPDEGNDVAMVGTRHMSEYGMNQAFGIACGLARGGCTVISGLARGIDGVSAAGAVEAGGKTVAVLGCGLDMVFPEEHSALAEAVAGNGALISEYAPGTLPLPHHFPERNRIISGLSKAVLVVEGGNRSGSVITGHLALEQNRKLFAVPADVDRTGSIGSNMLFREGASVALDAGDILGYLEAENPGSVDIVGYSESAAQRDDVGKAIAKYGILPPVDRPHGRAGKTAEKKIPVPALTPEPEKKTEKSEKTAPPEGRLREFWSEIPDGTRVGADSFIGSGYGVNESMNLLTMLEISGFVKSVPGGMFVKI